MEDLSYQKMAMRRLRGKAKTKIRLVYIVPTHPIFGAGPRLFSFGLQTIFFSLIHYSKFYYIQQQQITKRERGRKKEKKVPYLPVHFFFFTMKPYINLLVFFGFFAMHMVRHNVGHSTATMCLTWRVNCQGQA